MRIPKRLRIVGSAVLRPFPNVKRRVILRLNADDASRALRRYADSRGAPASFAQIGSHDGFYGDPLRPLVESHGWRGLCVEPVPSIFQRLVENYSAFDRMSFANVAVGIEDGTAPFFTVKARPGDPNFIDQVGSFDRDHLLKFSISEDRIIEDDVPVRTYRSLLDAHSITPDVVHVDAEGFDAVIVRQILDTREPEALLFEHLHMTEADHQALVTRLGSCGYAVVIGHTDTFASRG